MKNTLLWSRYGLGLALGVAVALLLPTLSSADTRPTGQLWQTRPASKSAPAVRAYDFSPLVRQIKPAVFNLSVEGTRAPKSSRGVWPFSRRFRFRSRGSGFFIHPKGYALTNYHVIRNATKIRAQLYDKREYRVKVLGKSPELDVALIRVIIPKNEKFTYAYLGDSSKIEVGSPVVAIGNARGLGLTVTSGIISAKGREVGSQYQAFIQTDAAINRGNSGGPLFNKKGEVVGINTAILRGGRGIGFAVPINIVKRILPQLQKRGFVQRAQLGVMIQAVTAELARSFRLPRPIGALVADVNSKSPAARGGVRVGDVIIAFNGRTIQNFTDLPRLVAFSPAGARAKLIIVRRGKRIVRTVRLVKWGQSIKAKADSDSDSGSGSGSDNFLNEGRRKKKAQPKKRTNLSKALRRLGVGVGSVPAAMRRQMNLEGSGGVLVTSVRQNSPAAKNGLKKGDVVIEINRTSVTSTRQFLKELSRVGAGDNVLMLVRRADSALFLAFPLP